MLIWKVFRNKELASEQALKMGLGQFRGATWSADTLLNCPNQISIFAQVGWEVCDGCTGFL
jgi:hypothetical protein